MLNENLPSSPEAKLLYLIKYLEEEAITLRQLIDICIKEEEFDLAKFHTNALYIVNHQLDIFRHFDDNLYQEKSSALYRIDVYEQMLQNNQAANNQYLKQQLEKEKIALEYLNNREKQFPNFQKETVLYRVVLKLINKEIDRFKLLLNKTENTEFHFSRTRGGVKIKIPHIKRYPDEDIVESLLLQGFQFSKNQTKLLFTIRGSSEELSSNIMLLLAKIILDIFYWQNFANECFIEITYKKDRKTNK